VIGATRVRGRHLTYTVSDTVSSHRTLIGLGYLLRLLVLITATTELQTNDEALHEHHEAGGESVPMILNES